MRNRAKRHVIANKRIAQRKSCANLCYPKTLEYVHLKPSSQVQWNPPLSHKQSLTPSQWWDITMASKGPKISRERETSFKKARAHL